MLAELRIENRRQRLQHHLLNEPIPYRRFNAANLSWGLSVGRSVPGPMDRP
jgi:hypothetical protein